MLVFGIIITRRVDTAIETNEVRKEVARKAILEFEKDCAAPSKQLITADTSTWARVEYTLPSFSSYDLDKKDGNWYLGKTPTNAAATQKYLGKIAAAASHCVVVHNNPKALKMPDYMLKIITTSADTLLFETYVVDTNYIVRDLEGNMYSGNDDSLFWQLYFGKQRFIPELANQ